MPDKPHLDPTTPIRRGFIAFLSALAQDGRLWIVKRANDGRATARKRGVHMGRKPKLNELQTGDPDCQIPMASAHAIP